MKGYINCYTAITEGECRLQQWMKTYHYLLYHFNRTIIQIEIPQEAPEKSFYAQPLERKTVMPMPWIFKSKCF